MLECEQRISISAYGSMLFIYFLGRAIQILSIKSFFFSLCPSVLPQICWPNVLFTFFFSLLTKSKGSQAHPICLPPEQMISSLFNTTTGFWSPLKKLVCSFSKMNVGPSTTAGRVRALVGYSSRTLWVCGHFRLPIEVRSLCQGKIYTWVLFLKWVQVTHEGKWMSMGSFLWVSSPHSQVFAWLSAHCPNEKMGVTENQCNVTLTAELPEVCFIKKVIISVWKNLYKF